MLLPSSGEVERALEKSCTLIFRDVMNSRMPGGIDEGLMLPPRTDLTVLLLERALCAPLLLRGDEEYSRWRAGGAVVAAAGGGQVEAAAIDARADCGRRAGVA